MANIVAVTACPTGIAHIFMAAEALKKAAASHGYDIKVKTQGSVGAKNQLSAEDIAAIAVGMIVTAAMLMLLKKPIVDGAAAARKFHCLGPSLDHTHKPLRHRVN